MPYFLFLLSSLFLHSGQSKTASDSNIIRGKNYSGYIMPLDRTEAKYDPDNIYYKPSRDEVILAEKMMASYLDIFCRLNNGWRQLDLSPADSIRYRRYFTGHFRHYFRQYTAYTPRKGGHKFVSICLVSPEFQKRVSDKKDYLKNNWAEVDDTGDILFHADIDLTTGDVFLRDNGRS